MRGFKTLVSTTGKAVSGREPLATGLRSIFSIVWSLSSPESSDSRAFFFGIECELLVVGRSRLSVPERFLGEEGPLVDSRDVNESAVRRRGSNGECLLDDGDESGLESMSISLTRSSSSSLVRSMIGVGVFGVFGGIVVWMYFGLVLLLPEEGVVGVPRVDAMLDERTTRNQINIHVV